MSRVHTHLVTEPGRFRQIAGERRRCAAALTPQPALGLQRLVALVSRHHDEVPQLPCLGTIHHFPHGESGVCCCRPRSQAHRWFSRRQFGPDHLLRLVLSRRLVIREPPVGDEQPRLPHCPLVGRPGGLRPAPRPCRPRTLVTDRRRERHRQAEQVVKPPQDRLVKAVAATPGRQRPAVRQVFELSGKHIGQPGRGCGMLHAEPRAARLPELPQPPVRHTSARPGGGHEQVDDERLVSEGSHRWPARPRRGHRAPSRSVGRAPVGSPAPARRVAGAPSPRRPVCGSVRARRDPAAPWLPRGHPHRWSAVRFPSSATPLPHGPTRCVAAQGPRCGSRRPPRRPVPAPPAGPPATAPWPSA